MSLLKRIVSKADAMGAGGPMPVQFDLPGAEAQANPNRDPFSPGAPLAPWTPLGSPPIGWAPPVSWNKVYDPSKKLGVRYEILRNFADSVTILNVVRDAAKRQIRALKWDIVIKDPKQTEHPRLQELKDYFVKPDRETLFSDWLSALLEDLFVIGAPSLGKLYDGNGKPAGLRVMDAATIVPVISELGTLQGDPSFAYYGVHYGIPYRGYRRNEIIYRPFNRRSFTPFGFSPVEQLLGWMLVALNRQTYYANWYAETSTPPTWLMAPSGWPDEKIVFWQGYLDTIMSGNTAQKHKARIIPGPLDPKPGRVEEKFDYQFDEALIRLTCESFGVSPSFIAKTSSLGKGTQGVDEAAEDMGLQCYITFVEETIQDYIDNDLRCPELEFRFLEQESNAKGKSESEANDLKVGLRTLNEVRTLRGDDPYDSDEFPEADQPMVLTPTGFVPFGQPPAKPEPVVAPGSAQAEPGGAAGGVTPPKAGTTALDAGGTVAGGAGAAGKPEPPAEKAMQPRPTAEENAGPQPWKLGVIPSPDPDFTVYLVDGDYVEATFDPDFTQGSNGYAHPEFVPADEVWIDDRQPDYDRQVVLEHHELPEVYRMRDFGDDYDAAHAYANGNEQAFRRATIEQRADAKADVARWRRVVKNAAKADRAPRRFESDAIPAGTRHWIEARLARGDSVKAFAKPGRARAKRWSTSTRAAKHVAAGEELWKKLLDRAAAEFTAQAEERLKKERGE